VAITNLAVKDLCNLPFPADPFLEFPLDIPIALPGAFGFGCVQPTITAAVDHGHHIEKTEVKFKASHPGSDPCDIALNLNLNISCPKIRRSKKSARLYWMYHSHSHRMSSANLASVIISSSSLPGICSFAADLDMKLLPPCIRFLATFITSSWNKFSDSIAYISSSVITHDSCVSEIASYTNWQAMGNMNNPVMLIGSGNAADPTDWDLTQETAVIYLAYRLYWSGNSGDPIKQFGRLVYCDSHGVLSSVSPEHDDLEALPYINTSSCDAA